MDDSPVEAIRSKPDSSIAVMCKLAAKGEADVVISAGNTGACVAAAQLRMRTLPGVSRPGIAVILPTFHGPVVICDVGANIAPKPQASPAIRDHGRGLRHGCLRHRKPRVGLLSHRRRRRQGQRTIVKEARKLMRDEPQINFVGNVEGRDLFKGVVDVVVCDGFVGNIVLKFTEGMAEGLFQTIVAELQEDAPELLEQFKPVMKKIYAEARLAGIRRRAAAGRGRILPDLPRPLREPGDQERDPRRQAIGAQRDESEDRREDRRRASRSGRAEDVANESLRLKSMHDSEPSSRDRQYVPEKRLTNDDLSKMVDTNDEWIVQRTGIRERRIAGRRRIDRDRWPPPRPARRSTRRGHRATDLDLIVCGTITPEMVFPPPPASSAPRWDSPTRPRLTCRRRAAGSFTRWKPAPNFVKAGAVPKRAGHRRGNPQPDHRLHRSRQLHSVRRRRRGGRACSDRHDPNRGADLQQPACRRQRLGDAEVQARQPPSRSAERIARDGDQYMKIKGREVYKFAVQRFEELIHDAMRKCELTAEQVKLIVPHQVNQRIIDSAMEKLGMPAGKGVREHRPIRQHVGGVDSRSRWTKRCVTGRISAGRCGYSSSRSARG